MTNKAFLGPIINIRGREATFGVKSFGMPIRAGTILKSTSGALVYVKCLRISEFEPEDRKKKSIEELASYVVEETFPGWTTALDVEGDIDQFTEDTEISIIQRPNK